MEKKRGGWRALVGFVAGSVLLLPCLYVGAYYATVHRAWAFPVLQFNSYKLDHQPGYRYIGGAGRIIFVIFGPMHNIDRTLRREYWSEYLPAPEDSN